MIRKAFFVLFVCACLVAGEGRARPAAASEAKPTHTIFLIHGIGGDKSHFGYMARVLSSIFNKKDPTTKYIVRNIEYDTGNDEKTPAFFKSGGWHTNHNQ